jgi:hypothetical protein
MDSLTITISKEGLKYSVLAQKKCSEIPNSLYFSYAEKLDKRFLLYKDTSGRRDVVFGIADDITEAHNRLHKSSKEIACMLQEVYCEKFSVEMIDEVEKGLGKKV